VPKLSVALPTLAGASAADLDRRAARIERTVDELRGDVNIVGDRDEIVAKVERLVALGAERVYFQLMDLQDVSHVEYLGEVLPHLPR
jgi:alkanesulfonate monooxygenase SsuD/methylene tetrahydromethanopterin reductase-like flavin-dependent oxidoreductase (luciferase family)